ncbi:MAG: carbon-nitrogen hydrolase family protein [Wenzhouxiangellaceae bacterium]
MTQDPTLRVALAQIAPIWLDREATLKRIMTAMANAAEQRARLVVFGEAFLPGYPFWVEHTDGAQFDNPLQHQIYAHYLDQAICIERGDLHTLCELAAELEIAVYLGLMERPMARGGNSLYASLAYISASGQIGSVHRKLMPTYEERLVWAPGDGHGLRTHALDGFELGGLNCWENWMPLPRASLYAQGENVHIAVWPGNPRNTEDITRFIARESRSYVVSVSSYLRSEQIPDDLPFYDDIIDRLPPSLAAGGSCVARPDGEWLLPPVINEEGVWTVDLKLSEVRRARQHFDPSGHYSRPDVTRLEVNRERQRIAHFSDPQESGQ